MPAASAAAGSSAIGARTTRWAEVVPRSIIAAGQWGSIPPATRFALTCLREETAI